MAEHYQTNRPTARRALAVLKAEELVIMEQGRGDFVRPKPNVRLVITGANFRWHRSTGLAGVNARDSVEHLERGDAMAPGNAGCYVAVGEEKTAETPAGPARSLPPHRTSLRRATTSAHQRPSTGNHG